MDEPLAVTLTCVKCRGSGKVKRHACHACSGKGSLRVLTAAGQELLDFLYEFLDPDLMRERTNYD